MFFCFAPAPPSPRDPHFEPLGRRAWIPSCHLRFSLTRLVSIIAAGAQGCAGIKNWPLFEALSTTVITLGLIVFGAGISAHAAGSLIPLGVPAAIANLEKNASGGDNREA